VNPFTLATKYSRTPVSDAIADPGGMWGRRGNSAPPCVIISPAFPTIPPIPGNARPPGCPPFPGGRRPVIATRTGGNCFQKIKGPAEAGPGIQCGKRACVLPQRYNCVRGDWFHKEKAPPVGRGLGLAASVAHLLGGGHADWYP